MKNSRNILILCFIGISLTVCCLYSCVKASNVNREEEEIERAYFEAVDYTLRGNVTKKTLVHKRRDRYKSLYLVELEVDSFIIRKNNLSQHSRFFGVYDTIAKKAYFFSPIYEPIESYKTDETLRLSVLTEFKRILGSNGLQQGLCIGSESDFDFWQKLLDKESKTTIRF